MPIQLPKDFDWNKLKPYSAFDKLLQSFIINQKSFLTVNKVTLDLKSAFREIREVFVENYDTGKEDYESKLERQFLPTSPNTKLVFNHIEYLWSMPVKNIGAVKMRSYCTRWPSEEEVKDSDLVFFGGSDSDCIANPGQHYLTNKYYELLALFELLETIINQEQLWEIKSLKLFIEQYCYDKLHINPPKKYCGLYAILLHLCAPEKYESIISKTHRALIPQAFADLLEAHKSVSCPEAQIKIIREALYDSYGNSTDSEWKYRWFFYCEDLVDTWKSTRVIKSDSKKSRQEAFILDEIQRELEYDDLSSKEGGKVKATGYRILRDKKIINAVKKDEKYTCQSCKFFFKNQIVHVHHLDPISEREAPRETTPKDLITLCPNCHYLAHYLLRTEKTNQSLKERAPLIERLQGESRFTTPS